MTPAATPAIMLVAIVLEIPMKPEEVPITIGRRLPMGPIG